MKDDKTIWWIAGSMFTIIMLLLSLLLNSYNNRMSEIEDFHIDAEKRVSVLENEAKHINEKLESIEWKIDYLVEKQANPARDGG